MLSTRRRDVHARRAAVFSPVVSRTVTNSTRESFGPEESRREFIRHPVEFPLEIESLGAAAPRSERSLNVSPGGLAFVSLSCPRVGDLVKVRIPAVDPPFEADARVAWCRPENGTFLVGVRFVDADAAFRSRMVQQVCAIEKYRQDTAEREGRRMTPGEAAAEWIERFAGAFPGAGGSD